MLPAELSSVVELEREIVGVEVGRESSAVGALRATVDAAAMHALGVARIGQEARGIGQRERSRPSG